MPLRRATAGALRELSARFRWGFSEPELARLQRYFRVEGRDPTDVELAGLAQSWSEHCSYKSSRPFLRAFARLRPDRRVLGTGDAGVMAFAPGYAYALRIESHNHPSAVEPYGGAATGIGGILRDVLAVGAKPIALTDPLFFGPLDLDTTPQGVKHPRYLMAGVVSGIRDYGNRVGVPTIAGGVFFDPAFTVNPLVNVGCVGFLPRRRLVPNRARAAGDRLVLVGGLTGRDGLGGVAFASKELTERSEDESRGAVQLGNPIMKEPLIHACLEAYDKGLVAGVKDLGGGGLASASGELVHAGGFGSRIDLDRVPLRETGLRPWEIWISESQERMLLDVPPQHVPAVLAIFARYDVPAQAVGEVTADGRERLFYKGTPAAELNVGFRVAPPPLRRRTLARRAPKSRLPPHVPEEGIPALFERLVLARECVSREPVLRVYDHEVQGETVVKPLHGHTVSPSHGDAAVLRPHPGLWKGLAVTVAARPSYGAIDPRAAGVEVVEEAARNLYAVGAHPDALTNCLNFGNPEDARVMGDFRSAVDGLAAAAQALRFAVPSGNVSLYNGGLGAGIPPTPVVMATGLVDDVRRCLTSDLKTIDDPLFLVGPSFPALGGSVYARTCGVRGGALPPQDPAGVKKAGDRLLTATSRGGVRASHDISEGGLAVTLAEMAFGGALGFDVDLQTTGLPGPDLALAAEGGSRWVVEVAPQHRHSFLRTMRGIPVAELGVVTAESTRLRWGPKILADEPMGSLYGRWREGVGIP
ncbi:MAG: phosphoribosylformylglycinamidine synthase subunit PurL [Thermoplasmata archaeon]|nr:phosphoribosylformylglycinamidine synthase subunit PurL [Thermoplasmata archaeon]